MKSTAFVQKSTVQIQIPSNLDFEKYIYTVFKGSDENIMLAELSQHFSQICNSKYGDNRDDILSVLFTNEMTETQQQRVVTYILDKYDPSFFNCKSKNNVGESALFIAIKRNLFDIVTYLTQYIEKHGNCICINDLINNSGQNALCECVLNPKIELLSKLIKDKYMSPEYDARLDNELFVKLFDELIVSFIENTYAKEYFDNIIEHMTWVISLFASKNSEIIELTKQIESKFEDIITLNSEDIPNKKQSLKNTYIQNIGNIIRNKIFPKYKMTYENDVGDRFYYKTDRKVNFIFPCYYGSLNRIVFTPNGSSKDNFQYLPHQGFQRLSELNPEIDLSPFYIVPINYKPLELKSFNDDIDLDDYFKLLNTDYYRCNYEVNQIDSIDMLDILSNIHYNLESANKSVNKQFENIVQNDTYNFELGIVSTMYSKLFDICINITLNSSCIGKNHDFTKLHPLSKGKSYIVAVDGMSHNVFDELYSNNFKSILVQDMPYALSRPINSIELLTTSQKFNKNAIEFRALQINDKIDKVNKENSLTYSPINPCCIFESFDMWIDIIYGFLYKFDLKSLYQFIARFDEKFKQTYIDLLKKTIQKMHIDLVTDDIDDIDKISNDDEENAEKYDNLYKMFLKNLIHTHLEYLISIYHAFEYMTYLPPGTFEQANTNDVNVTLPNFMLSFNLLPNVYQLNKPIYNIPNTKNIELLQFVLNRNPLENVWLIKYYSNIYDDQLIYDLSISGFYAIYDEDPNKYILDINKKKIVEQPSIFMKLHEQYLADLQQELIELFLFNDDNNENVDENINENTKHNFLKSFVVELVDKLINKISIQLFDNNGKSFSAPKTKTCICDEFANNQEFHIPKYYRSFDKSTINKNSEIEGSHIEESEIINPKLSGGASYISKITNYLESNMSICLFNDIEFPVVNDINDDGAAKKIGIILYTYSELLVVSNFQKYYMLLMYNLYRLLDNESLFDTEFDINELNLLFNDFLQDYEFYLENEYPIYNTDNKRTLSNFKDVIELINEIQNDAVDSKDLFYMYINLVLYCIWNNNDTKRMRIKKCKSTYQNQLCNILCNYYDEIYDKMQNANTQEKNYLTIELNSESMIIFGDIEYECINNIGKNKQMKLLSLIKTSSFHQLSNTFYRNLYSKCKIISNYLCNANGNIMIIIYKDGDRIIVLNKLFEFLNSFSNDLFGSVYIYPSYLENLTDLLDPSIWYARKTLIQIIDDENAKILQKRYVKRSFNCINLFDFIMYNKKTCYEIYYNLTDGAYYDFKYANPFHFISSIYENDRFFEIADDKENVSQEIADDKENVSQEIADDKENVSQEIADNPETVSNKMASIKIPLYYLLLYIVSLDPAQLDLQSNLFICKNTGILQSYIYDLNYFIENQIVFDDYNNLLNTDDTDTNIQLLNIENSYMFQRKIQTLLNTYIGNISFEDIFGFLLLNHYGNNMSDDDTINDIIDNTDLIDVYDCFNDALLFSAYILKSDVKGDSIDNDMYTNFIQFKKNDIVNISIYFNKLYYNDKTNYVLSGGLGYFKYNAIDMKVSLNDPLKPYWQTYEDTILYYFDDNYYEQFDFGKLKFFSQQPNKMEFIKSHAYLVDEQTLTAIYMSQNVEALDFIKQLKDIYLMTDKLNNIKNILKNKLQYINRQIDKLCEIYLSKIDNGESENIEFKLKNLEIVDDVLNISPIKLIDAIIDKSSDLLIGLFDTLNNITKQIAQKYVDSIDSDRKFDHQSFCKYCCLIYMQLDMAKYKAPEFVSDFDRLIDLFINTFKDVYQINDELFNNHINTKGKPIFKQIINNIVPNTIDYVFNRYKLEYNKQKLDKYLSF